MKNICYESTWGCNLKCDYCISADNHQSIESSESIVPYQKIIDTIALCQPERLVINGGEPLLDDDLLDKLEYIRGKCPDTFVSLSTNGAVAFDFEKLTGKIDCIDFSIPALDGNVYQTMRGLDLVEQVKENIGRASASGAEIRLSYTLTKVNEHELEAVLKFAEEMKAAEVRIGRFFPFRKAASCKEKYELTDAEINHIMGKVTKKDYPFRLVPPIQNLEYMEKGYLTVNYLGEIFLPTREGKKILAKVGEVETGKVKQMLEEESQEKIFVSTNTRTVQNYIRDILQPKRIRKSSKEGERSILEEYYSDRSRILYSQAFRRLQQKAQVFSLETNSSVHSRLTHSLEVSDVGRRMAKKIVEKLSEVKYPQNKFS